MTPRTNADLCRLVGGISFFEGLSPEALEAVCARMVRRSVPRGVILFRRGEACRGAYLLVRGKVEVYRATSEGREQVLHVEHPPASVAELPLFDGGEYPASARTATESELYYLSIDDFRRLVREHPDVAEAVIRNLGARLRRMLVLVERISLKSVPARVASLLLEQARRANALGAGTSFQLVGTHEDWAHQLATSRESVARALGRFRRMGWIRQEGKTVTVASPGKLKELADGDG